MLVRRARIPEQLAQELEKLLQDGVWGPGMQIPPERELAQRFGVSRASVRDALRILELHGWLEIRQGGGTRVAQPAEGFGKRLRSRLHEPAFVSELFEMRRILEPAAVALAARRVGAEELAKLDQLIEEQKAAFANRFKFVELDMDFHQVLAEASGNTVLCEVLRLLSVELRQTRMTATAKRFLPDNTLLEHQQILEAVRRKKPERAKEAMLQHLDTVERATGVLGQEEAKR